jgi:DNA-binding FadR family transcriptional regulator
MTSPLIIIRARRSHSNHAEIARSIGIDIIVGRYPDGTKLPGDAELTLTFGVSRPVLREAVKTLVAKGLLSTKARVGTVVRPRAAWNMFDPDVLAWHLDAGIDKSFLTDLAEIRLAIEPRTAALAAERRTEADLILMRTAIERMRAEAARQTADFAEADLSLHIAIANAAGNPFMRSIGAVIAAALRASFQLSAPKDSDDYRATVAAHQQIVDAIAERDPVAAATAMTNVILNGLRRHAPAS